MKRYFQSSDEESSENSDDETEACNNGKHDGEKEEKNSRRKSVSLKSFLKKSQQKNAIYGTDVQSFLSRRENEMSGIEKKIDMFSSQKRGKCRGSPTAGVEKKKKKRRKRAYDSDTDDSNEEGETLLATSIVSEDSTYKSDSQNDETASMDKTNERCSLTLGDLMRPESNVDSILSPSLGIKNKSATSRELATGNVNSLNNASNSGTKHEACPGSSSDHTESDDTWMEGGDFEDVTTEFEALKKGNVSPVSLGRGNSSRSSKTNPARRYEPPRAIKTRYSKLSKEDASDLLAECNSCLEAHRPDFPDRVGLDISSLSLELQYCKEGSKVILQDKAKNKETSISIHEALKPDKAQQAPAISHESFSTSVPVTVMRYLKSYQVQGVKWLWEKYSKRLGCILGDDMGLGKTVQVAAFLVAVYGKTGLRDVDMPRNRERCRNGYSLSFEVETAHASVEQFPPTLIIGPASVMANWRQELDRWGYFLISSLEDKQSSLSCIEKAATGRVELVLGSYNKMTMYSKELSSVQWSVVIWDEGHTLKNDNSKLYKAAAAIKARSRVILSGTPVQNELEEFWCLLNLVTAGRFNDKSSFKKHFVVPIKKAQQQSASSDVVEQGNARVKELRKIARRYLLQRRKEDVLQHELHGKDEIIVFCEMSPLQQKLYEEVLALPDVHNCRYYAAPCPCGSKIARNKCSCSTDYSLPRDGSSTDGIDPRAVLWRQIHPTGEECSHCPTCVLMSVLPILSKLASHPILLQAPHDCDTSQSNDYRFATQALTADSLAPIGGPMRKVNMLHDAPRYVEHSGKMKTLDTLLKSFCAKMEKTLLFSLSTKTLSLIESFVKARGWRSCRLDGNTPTSVRQTLVDKFNKDSNILVFLISTRAGGVGLNLTSASKVIIFDCNWNPSQDAQAQDRAYRMGQLQHVSVYRLIAQGTIDEMAYMRQLYKQVLQEAAVGKDSGDIIRGSFEGIQGDSDARGELFGAENMLQFLRGSLLLQLRRQYGISSDHESSSPQTPHGKNPHSKDKNGDHVRGLPTLNEKSAGAILSLLSGQEKTAEADAKSKSIAS